MDLNSNVIRYNVVKVLSIVDTHDTHDTHGTHDTHDELEAYPGVIPCNLPDKKN